jgi:hypothetical protein
VIGSERFAKAEVCPVTQAKAVAPPA